MGRRLRRATQIPVDGFWSVQPENTIEITTTATGVVRRILSMIRPRDTAESSAPYTGDQSAPAAFRGNPCTSANLRCLELRMRRPILLIAAGVAFAVWLFLPHGVFFRHRSVGLEARIAQAVPCGADLPPVESVRVLRPGRVMMHSVEMSLGELDHRLEATFRDRVRCVVLLSAENELQFFEIAQVLETVRRHADYVALVTPEVEKAARSNTWLCLGPNITFPEILM